MMFDSMQGIKDLRRPLHLDNDMREHGFVDVDQRMSEYWHEQRRVGTAMLTKPVLMPTCAWSDGK